MTSTGAGAKDIFLDALEQPDAERARFVAEACRGDAALRERVEALLVAHAGARSLIDSPRPRPFARIVDLGPGDRVGPYRLGEPLGEGGFGVVYRAEQDEPVSRSVALKVVKLGMDTKAVIARFEAERQALAMMEHPNIARVLDVGATESGRPYFAMELVDGEPITTYCDRAGLDTRARLELFRIVCHAVQHAHQKGIIHRDLKPSNVLVGEVDGKPVPKVIDFGIAKATGEEFSERSCVSTDGQLIGTPAYMSPEQAAASPDIDTRTDIYSLGVLLYELLSGAPPFSLRELGFAELQRAVREDDPPRPSTQRRKSVEQRRGAETRNVRIEVPSDLDWIVLHALEKEPTRRYPTAYALAHDIERFLDDRPVEAAPPGVGYRMYKLGRRHRAATVAGLVVLVSLVVGGAAASVGLVAARRANAELDDALEFSKAETARAEDALVRAEQEAARAREAEARAASEAAAARTQADIASAVNEFLTEDLLGAVAPSTRPGHGRDVLMRDVLDVASESLDAGGPQGIGRFADAPLVDAAVRAMIGTTYIGLGEYEAAIPHLERAAEIREELLGPDDELTLRALSELTSALRRTNRLEESDAILERVFDIQRRKFGFGHQDTVYAAARMARNHIAAGRNAEAVALCDEVLPVALRELGEENEAVIWLIEALGQGCTQSADYARAEEAFERVVDIRRRTGGPESDLAGAMSNLARLYSRQYRRDEAEPLYRESVAIHERVLGPSHPSTISGMCGLGFVWLSIGRIDDAEDILRETLRRANEDLGASHPETLQAKVELARVFQLRTRLDEAEVLLREAYDTFLEIGSSRPSNVRSVAKDLALLYMRTGRVEESRELLEELLEFESELLAPAHPDIQRTRLYLGQLYFLISRFEDTERMYLDGLAAARAQDGPPDSFSLSFTTDLARIYNRTQRHEKAEPHARNALEWARVKVSDQSLEMLLALLELGISLGRQGKLDEAEAPLLESYQLAVGSYPTVQSRLIAAGELLRLYRAQGRAADAERFAEILAPWGETDFLQSR